MSETRTVSPDRINSSKSITGESELYTETDTRGGGGELGREDDDVGDVACSYDTELRLVSLRNNLNPFLLPDDVVELTVFVLVLVLIIDTGRPGFDG